MTPLYEIGYKIGQFENLLQVFADRVIVRKNKINSRAYSSGGGSLFQLAKLIFQMFGKKSDNKLIGKLNAEYIGIDATFDQIDEVYFKPSANNLLATGMLVFYLKGRPHNQVTHFNYKDADNAIFFKAKDNNTAQMIKLFIDNMITKHS